MQSLDLGAIPAFRFLLVIPVADRPSAISGCLNSIANHLAAFPFGRITSNEGIRRFRDIRVLVVDDGKQSEYALDLVHHFLTRGLEVEWASWPRQQEVLSSIKTPSVRPFLGDSQDLPPRGAGITGNIAKVLINQTIFLAEPGPPWLIWHLDSDHQLTSLTMNNAGETFLQDDALDYFKAWCGYFADPSIEMITGPVTGDPTVSPMVMINTVLDDLREFASAAHKMPPMAPGIPADCTIDRYTSEKMAYYDFDKALRGRFARPQGSYSPLVKASSLAQQAETYFDTLPQSLYGHHPTRPIMAPHVKECNSTLWPGPLPSRMIFTGNYIYRASMLHYPLPFVSYGPRLIGPIYGTVLRAFVGPKVRFVNLPVYHARIPDGELASESRAGVFRAADLINVEAESCRQVVGDVLLRFVEESTRKYLIGPAMTSRPPAGLDTVFGDAVAHTQRLYIAHIAHTDELLHELLGHFSGSAQWWQPFNFSSGSMQNVALFLRSVAHNFASGSSVDTFVQNLPEAIGAGEYLSEAGNLEANWLAWSKEALKLPCK